MKQIFSNRKKIKTKFFKILEAVKNLFTYEKRNILNIYLR